MTRKPSLEKQSPAGALMRIVAKLAYDGTAFKGFTGIRDEHLKPVLETVHQAQGDLHILAASRTDKGVHARANFCAYDAPDAHQGQLDKIKYSANQLLRDRNIHIQELAQAPTADFDPRTNRGKE